jgi:hypothetical protein
VGHISRDCPKDKKKPGGKASTNGLNLSEDEAKELNSLIAAKKAEINALSTVPTDAKFEVSFKGKIMAKYCHICGRFGKGNKAHYTAEHKSARIAPPATPDPPVAAPVAALAEALPPVPPQATLAAISPLLMRCEVPDYDTPSYHHHVHFAYDDDESVDSTYHACSAFMAFAPPPEEPPDSPAMFVSTDLPTSPVPMIYSPSTAPTHSDDPSLVEESFEDAVEGDLADEESWFALHALAVPEVFVPGYPKE